MLDFPWRSHPEDRRAYLSPALRQKLSAQLKQRFTTPSNDGIPGLLQAWAQEVTWLGEPPTSEQITAILFTEQPSQVDFQVLNGLCWLMLEAAYRDNTTLCPPPDLKQSLQSQFQQTYQRGNRIAWKQFFPVWEKYNGVLGKPPSEETIRQFLTSGPGESCESWLIDGLCKLLLNCSYKTWIEEHPKPSVQPVYVLGETRWVGRDRLVEELLQHLMGDCRILEIVGITGIGKSSLAMRLALAPELANRMTHTEVLMFDEGTNFQQIAHRLLGEQLGGNETLQQDPALLIKTLVSSLRAQPCLLVLDMLETMLVPDGMGGHRFQEALFLQFLEAVVRADCMPSRIIITSQHRLPAIAEGRYPHLTHTTAPLDGLTITETEQLFTVWDVKLQEAADLEILSRLRAAYEGHPLALKVIAGETRSRYDGDLQAYWHDYQPEIVAVETLKAQPDDPTLIDNPRLDRYSFDLVQLVRRRIEQSFERLRQDSEAAYWLLCLGAKPRRPVDRAGWTFVLLEYAPEDREIAFELLRQRFLLEEEYTPQQRRRLYRLHSLIRGVALEHLRRL